MKNDSNRSETSYPKGHFVGLWIGIGTAIFSGFGVVFSIVIDNFSFIGVGIAIGVSVGVAIGQSIENKYQVQVRIRPLKPQELRNRRIALWVSFAVLTLGVVLATILFLKN